MKNIDQLVRPNILQLQPYASARSEFKGKADIFLDANESPYESNYNRYPDPLQWKLKEAISSIKQVAPEHIFLGNGSDEAIDLLLRIFCEPGEDHIVTLPPTYGMYRVSAGIANVQVKEVSLDARFQPRPAAILEQCDEHSKLLFICSPNNPTGNTIPSETIAELATSFHGITVVDEAYIDFSFQQSSISLLEEHPRLVVLQTFSKAWGMAGIRLGMAFASTGIIDLFNKVKPPYNINQLTQDAALQALENQEQVAQQITQILGQRTLLQQYLSSLDYVERIYPSEANFILVKMKKPREVYQYLMEKGIIVRDRSRVELCEGCLRITIGTPEENEKLFQTLLTY
jgi:histidinol-phosphate aminotransferase